MYENDIDDVDFGEMGDLVDGNIDEIAARNVNRKPYKIRLREDNFNKWDDSEFFKRFRLSKQTVMYILTEIEEDIRHRTDRNNPVSPMNQLLMALRFYATGNMLISIGDFGGVHLSTVSKMIWKVTDAIARLRPKWIKFPSSQEDILKTQREFYRMARFPRVIGCVDCTHIKILSPGGPEAEVFRNRKGYFSLNVQVIGGPKLQVQNVVARWPGSAHDSNILANSRINAQFEFGEFGDALLLGDGGYGLTNFLMTPLTATNNLAQELYNESLIRTRNSIERLFGVMKRRFPVLSIGMRVAVSKVQNVIVAACVLHNMAIHFKENDPPVDTEVAIPLVEQPHVEDALQRDIPLGVQQQLLDNYFLPLARRQLEQT